MLKLNLGCGPDWRVGYINVDCESAQTLRQWARLSARPEPESDRVFLQLDLRKPWPWHGGSADEIVAANFLEHLDHAGLNHLLTEAYRVLAAGGVMLGVVPDIEAIVDLCRRREVDDWDANTTSGPYPEKWMNALSNFCHGWGHLQVFTREMLQARLEGAGFHTQITRFEVHGLSFVATKSGD